jgi:5-methylcytosine-specific restriction enzyme subunit McrC
MIPIENLYYLLLYAWDVLDEGQLVDISAESRATILDLLAAVLNRGTDQLLRRGLDRGYLSQREAIPGVRGKLDVSATIKANLLTYARTVCEFDELTYDILHNQILKATLLQLLRVADLATEMREPLRATCMRLHEIRDIKLTDRAFRSVQLHRHARMYRFLLDVCRLVRDCLVPEETTGNFRFRDFIRDKKRMNRLFERFLFNFYRREQTTFPRVLRKRVSWAQTTGTHLELLPEMRTDVFLISPERRIVIDAKYYRETLTQYRSKRTIRSGHLYQLFAYLRNLPARSSSAAPIEGMLVYPQTGQALDATYSMHGHVVRVCTIDLNGCNC